MKFPRLTREQNRRCKLSNEQIADIQSRRGRGETYLSIATRYKVSPQTIIYWCMTEKQRSDKIKRQNSVRIHTIHNPIYHKEYRERKKQIHSNYGEYEKFSNKRYKKHAPEEYREKGRQRDREYYHAHKNKKKTWILLEKLEEDIRAIK